MEEDLFAACTRMRDLMREWNRDHPAPDHYQFPEDGDFEEVCLNAEMLDAAFNFFRNPRFTFNDFWELTKRNIVWFGRDLFFKAKGEGVGVTDACWCLGFGRPIVVVELPNDLNNTGGE